MQRVLELLERARADDGGGHAGPPEKPSDRDVRRLLPDLGAELFVRLELRAMLLDFLLEALTCAPARRGLLEHTAE